MSGYGYYDEEGSGLLSSIIGGGNEGGLYTGGGTRSFAVPIPGMSGRLAYVQKGYYAPRLPSLQWGIRRVLRQVINQKNPSDRRKTWMNIARAKMQEAKEAYLKTLTPKERDEYFLRQARAQIQKQRKRQKVDMIRRKLESLKVGDDIDKTAEEIKKALYLEGSTKARLLRSALKVLFPDKLIPKKGDEVGKRQVREQLKKYNFAGIRRPLKATTALIGEKGFDRISHADVEALAKQLKEKSGFVDIEGPPPQPKVEVVTSPGSTVVEKKKKETR
jgi:hypothetical protein